MPEYLYILRPTRPEMLTGGAAAEEDRIVDEHFHHLQRLTEAGVMILVGRTLTTGPETIGVVIFRAASEDEARRITGSDPAVAQGVMTAELLPFRVALKNLAD